ncbi:MAG TPA: putative porin, partial [Flavobacteriaceae bacterium]|nr:putative porin [Flavobacteriaceae bacterium]
MNKNNSGIENDTLSSRLSGKSTSNAKIKNKDAKIEQYLIISHLKDTTFVDTTLSIKKEYKFNYLRKDNIELMPFSNIGQTYNTLAYNFSNQNLMPLFAARARHFNYMEIEDIKYYHVPTPLTELFYKSAFEQGQLLDAFFTVNTSKQLNFGIGYKGLRSLGKYQNILTSTGNFRFITSYKTKNNRYVANGHIVMQDLYNQENGGLQNTSVPFFESGVEEFLDRGVLDVNFENADNNLEGRRFHLDHWFNIIKSQDSVSNNKLNIEHVISFEDKYYEFNQTTNNAYFGDAYVNRIKDKVTLENFYNRLQLNYENNILGALSFHAAHNNYNYGYNKVLNLQAGTITNRIKGDIISVGGSYKKQLGGFNLEGALGLNVSGDFEGNFITGKASYKITDDIELGAEINHSSKAPNYNMMLFHSDYVNYNWQTQFNNTETQNLKFSLKSNKIAHVEVDISNINDYTYFARDADSMIKPFQSDKAITYLKVKAQREFKYWKLALDNTIIYQNVQDENTVLNVPQIITRNTLYYSDHVFKRAMFLQTGITFNYFSEYYMNGYDPLLAEFYTQTNRKFGGFPRFDFFVNAKVRQTRIYLKAEHFNSAWTGYKYYSAPNYP